MKLEYEIIINNRSIQTNRRNRLLFEKKLLKPVILKNFLSAVRNSGFATHLPECHEIRETPLNCLQKNWFYHELIIVQNLQISTWIHNHAPYWMFPYCIKHFQTLEQLLAVVYLLPKLWTFVAFLTGMHTNRIRKVHHRANWTARPSFHRIR